MDFESSSSRSDLYYVESVIDIRKNQIDEFEILIKWKNYPHTDNTWEPLDHQEEDPLVILRALKENYVGQLEKRETKFIKKKLKHVREAIFEMKQIMKNRNDGQESNFTLKLHSSESSKEDFKGKTQLLLIFRMQCFIASQIRKKTNETKKNYKTNSTKKN